MSDLNALRAKIAALPEYAQQRVEWQARTTLWLVEHVSAEHQDTALEMITSAFRQADADGTREAAILVRELATRSSGDTARVLDIAARAIDELALRNAASVDPPSRG